LLTCAGYYVGGVIAIVLRFQPSGISGIWLPHGVLLAALVLTPPRRWWIHAALLLPTHFHVVSTFQGPVPLLILFIQYAGATGQAALAAAVLRPIVRSAPRLSILSAMTALIVIGTLLVPLVGSVLVAWLFTVTGWATDFWMAWQRRSFAGMCGGVIVAPAIIDLATGGLSAARRAASRRRLEYLVLTAGLVAVLVGLLGWRRNHPDLMWLTFAPAPLLLWSAARFGPAGLGPHLLAISLLALFKARAGDSPFDGPAGPETVLALQFIAAGHLHSPDAAVRAGTAVCRRRPGPAGQRGAVSLGGRGPDRTHLSPSCRRRVHLRQRSLQPVRQAPARGADRARLLAASPGSAACRPPGVARLHHAGAPVASSEHRVLGPGGEVRWQQWTDRGFFDEHGRIIDYQSVGHDITERKRAEEAARDSEKQIRLFIQQTPAALAMFDRDMRYLSYSQRWLTDYRLGDQNLVGRSHYEVFPEIPERWKDIHRRCLAGAVETCEEAPFRRGDGSLDWIRWDVRPWHNHQHEIGGIVMLTEVITDRKQAQEEHRQLLAQRQVAEALREVDRRKDEFLAMLAHELRNPLAPICSAVEVLRLDAPSDKTVVWVGDVIARQSAQLTRLVDDLLDVSRINLGKVKLDLEQLDLGPIITQAIETIRPVLLACPPRAVGGNARRTPASPG
jgi:PAS domain S-box-containing protein